MSKFNYLKLIHKFQPDKSINEVLLLETSPPSLLSIVTHSLGPGDIIRTSGKFTKPTKIPGKNYSKDEIVIKNADSGKGEFLNSYLTTITCYSFYNNKKKNINMLL